MKTFDARSNQVTRGLSPRGTVGSSLHRDSCICHLNMVEIKSQKSQFCTEGNRATMRQEFTEV